MAPFVQIGVVNPQGLARYILQYGFNIKDVSMLLNDPATAQAQQAQINGEPAEQGALPPGGEMPPEEAAMPQDMAMAMGPEAAMGGPGPPMEQMPQGGPQIPPELLAALGAAPG
jgi:hypothetical protein